MVGVTGGRKGGSEGGGYLIGGERGEGGKGGFL